MIVRALPEASQEAREATEYYVQRSEESAFGFLDALQRAFDEIRRRPLMHPWVLTVHTRQEYQSVLLERFPYEVVYRVLSDSVQVVAVAHTSRQPG